MLKQFHKNIKHLVDDLLLNENILFVTGPFINNNSINYLINSNHREMLKKCDFRKNPKLWWEIQRKLMTNTKDPTFAHQSLFEIMELLVEIEKTPHVITQNLDSLHERAGIVNKNILIHAHGQENKLCCTNIRCSAYNEGTLYEKKNTDSFHAICSLCAKILVPYSLDYNHPINAVKDNESKNHIDSDNNNDDEIKIKDLFPHISRSNNNNNSNVSAVQTKDLKIRAIINNYMSKLNLQNIKIYYRIDDIMKYATSADVLIFIGMDPHKDEDSANLMQFVLQSIQPKCKIHYLNLDPYQIGNKNSSQNQEIHEINVSPDMTLMSILGDFYHRFTEPLKTK